ncbi:hypothetical protein BA1DRAFT_04096 [Photorhabdus aegyptia]|uniref:Uncharacterized protein n=1 Tax=Photorhabdus aegyptia TaxID=2805098 RepID=A0A022PD11_9GAMM|nr:hypothetical protein BA1DRAFT_04096 [Photorhabdus aegyptia]
MTGRINATLRLDSVVSSRYMFYFVYLRKNIRCNAYVNTIEIRFCMYDVLSLYVRYFLRDSSNQMLI